jgi:hypothetical protein
MGMANNMFLCPGEYLKQLWLHFSMFVTQVDPMLEMMAREAAIFKEHLLTPANRVLNEITRCTLHMSANKRKAV